MSESTSGVQCHVCGLYDARVFDPSGAMWCRVCDILGLGSMAVAEKVAEIAEGVGKAFDEAALFDPEHALGKHLDKALREALATPIDTAVLYGGKATEAGDPDAWEPHVPDYAAINARWREQMGEAAAHVPTAAEALAAYEGPLVDEIAGRTARIGEALVAGVDEINAQLRAGADDGVRPDLMGKLTALLAETPLTVEARTWLPGDDDDEVPSPGPLYTIPEPPQVFPTVFVPGIVDSLDQADRGYIWKDTEGARWGWTKPHGWVAWNGGVAPYSRGAVGPFVFDGPNLCDENGRPPTDLPEWIKRMQAADSNDAGGPLTSADAETSNVPPRVDYCCGGGANPGGHEWNCSKLLNLQPDTVADLAVETSLLVEGDAVEHPSHYTSSKAACKGCGRPIECIDIVEHMGYSLGNVTKYVWRCDLKWDAIEDLRKARQYLDFEIAKREREAAAGA
ncbi:hypothetical protein FGG30_gp053 [Mycobacterium phage Pixie]|uniref:Uncharacterized protein n=1 Tax=Mycobacterium phage Pixie TaxID=2922215 RepID=G1D562_9CAUD|nr:hypothetical protein FGG30_gp053 [Mycobacterium phage Pixie]AEK09865.1 hypothetical protein PBI_PIXIE_53 [Mycobacterium phage Pixie]